MKSKTVAAWLALLGGLFGLHRFYLKGSRDLLAWVLPIPTALGAYGVWRVQEFGLDDRLSWLLLPPMGFTAAGCALTAIVYGLMTPRKWNDSFNASVPGGDEAGRTNGLTIIAVVLSLLLGTAALMSSITFSIQRYFEYTQASSAV